MGRAQAARSRRIGALACALAIVGFGSSPVAASDAAVEAVSAHTDKPPSRNDQLHADLDGAPIDLADVGKWYCHDFDYPAIHCYTDPAELDPVSAPGMAVALPQSLSGETSLAAAGVNYLIVYEFTSYQGAYMFMSEDYSILALIGWNDRISSFVVVNSQSGAFWTNWLYSGTRYNFCCNQSVASLGSFNDTFSSVFRN